ncbi:hypothetical protein [Streptomyces antimycoticus]|uniref:hypothetical protein n=1 Tax=Streptomyces antimycoticus TaxID=68175 RepID=UPI0036E03E99
MAQIPDGSPHPQHTSTDHLPAERCSPETAVESVRPDRAPSFGVALVRSLDEASTAVSSLSARNPSSDVSVSAFAALECVGATPADALQAAADAARQAPHLEPHGLSLARVPGPVEGLWEWNITLTVSARDPETGEYGGPTHHTGQGR